MAVLGPGIREVQVDPVHFPFVKILADQFGVSPYKEKVLRLGLIQLVKGSDQHTGILLNTDIVDIRVLLRQLIDKFTFSGTDLQMNRVIVSKSLSPFSFTGRRILHDPLTLRYSLSRAGNISKPHLQHLFCLKCKIDYHSTIFVTIQHPVKIIKIRSDPFAHRYFSVIISLKRKDFIL